MTRRRFIKTIAKGTLLSALAMLPNACCGSDSQGIYRGAEKCPWDLIALNKPHHGEGVFLNPFNPNAERGLGRVIRWKLFSANKFRSEYADEKVVPIEFTWNQVRSHDGLSITYMPHAGVLIKDRGFYILIDPIFDGLLPWIKNFTPIAGGLGQMPVPDLILITHGHYDHLDKKTLSRFDKATQVLTPLGYEKELDDIGMHHQRQLDWFDTYDDGRRRVTLLPCDHWTMRNPIKGPNRSLWGSYLIETAGGPTLYFAGDTAYFEGFKEIGGRYSVDVALFNLGAYEPRWFMKDSHMNPEETVQAFSDIRARMIMILHWGTFRLGDEPVHTPPEHLEPELSRAGLMDRWIRLSHGQTYYF
jgi:N-acyl-phosphatidylethanolamine-hydrolysing phospholipase D